MKATKVTQTSSYGTSNKDGNATYTLFPTNEQIGFGEKGAERRLDQHATHSIDENGPAPLSRPTPCTRIHVAPPQREHEEDSTQKRGQHTKEGERHKWCERSGAEAKDWRDWDYFLNAMIDMSEHESTGHVIGVRQCVYSLSKILRGTGNDQGSWLSVTHCWQTTVQGPVDPWVDTWNHNKRGINRWCK